MVISGPHKIYLDKSPVHGWGVFATKPIVENEIIEICPIIDMGIKKGESSPILIDYRFNWPQGTADFEKQVICSGYGMMYNHNETPNAAWRSNLENNTFEFYALKNIRQQEEIFTWYGDTNYWNDGRTHTLVI